MFKKIIFLIILFQNCFAQEGICRKINQLNNVIQQNHISPKPINDSLSVFLFNSILNTYDGSRNLISKSEFDILSKNKYQIDDLIQKNDNQFFEEFSSIYIKALLRNKQILEKLKTQNLDYTTKDTVRFSRKSFPFDVDDADFEKVWNKRIKYDVLEQISSLSKNFDSLKNNFKSLELKHKNMYIDDILCEIDLKIKNKSQFDIDFTNNVLNFFCSYFDPHSNYFSPEAKSNFIAGLSTSSLSTGLIFSMNGKKEIVVEEILPLSAADKTKQFEKGDIIDKVIDKDGKVYDVSCSDLDKIGELIYSDLYENIQLVVRKKNGSQQNISIQKTELKDYDNEVFSFVISYENKKYGYLKIPSFYSDFDVPPKGCTQDVIEEMIKLKSENIEGLIIDLQENGGGSMDEAIRLASIFIDQGPISALIDRKKKINILKDLQKGLIFDQNIAILINTNSASASEFFTASMQDYKRAIVIGSQSLGKATMQQIIPLSNENPVDFVKLTIEKFYRVTGKSNQIEGITPDIIVPTLFDNIQKREKDLPNALANDVLDLKLKFKPFQIDFTKAIEKSQQRITNSTIFNEIKDLNIAIKNNYEGNKKPVRVALKDVFEETWSLDTLMQRAECWEEYQNKLAIGNNKLDMIKIQNDSFVQELNTIKLKSLKKNPTVLEAIMVLNDLNSKID